MAHDEGWQASKQARRRCAGTAMVHDGRALWEEPAVRTVAEDVHVGGPVRDAVAEPRPAARQQHALPGRPRGLVDDLRRLDRIAQHQASESDVHGLRLRGLEEDGEVVWRRVVVRCRLEEDEASHLGARGDGGTALKIRDGRGGRLVVDSMNRTLPEARAFCKEKL